MPATDYQGSSVPFASLGRSILSIRRDQVHANMDGHDGGGGEANDLDSFQRHVTDLFADLAAADDVLSIAWIRRLLDTFLVCQEEFRVILFNHRAAAARPPLDRFISDFADRSVKALDVCNAIRDGIEQLRQWQKHLEIVLAALPCSNSKALFGEGQLRRAKKALTDITILMLDEKETGPSLSHRNRSFGRSGGSSTSSTVQRSHFRSLSWSVSRSWSAARQLQAIGSNVSAPRSHEVVSTSGLAVPVYTMSSVLLFVMWALVAAIPCQDRGLHAHFSIPRSFTWAAPIMSLHEKIVEESKKKDRRNSVGLLREIHQMEKCAHQLIEVADSVQFPLVEEKETEVRDGVEEIAQVCDALKEGLKPLERQVREVFLRIVRSRTEVFDSSIHGSE